jgi:hypothetical protein
MGISRNLLPGREARNQLNTLLLMFELAKIKTPPTINAAETM